MNKLYAVIDISNDTIYTKQKNLDTLMSWICSHCTQYVLHNHKIYATYIVDEVNTSIVTVDVLFDDKKVLSI